MTPLFPLGQLLATPAALEQIQSAGDSILAYINRHVTGDWGTVDDHDRRENELSLREGFRIMSVYILSNGATIWVITDRDRSVTTVLLPEEY